MMDSSPTELTDEQIINGWGNLGPVVVQMRRRIEALEARLPAPTPIAALARPLRHIGNLAVEPTRATMLTCEDCAVSWLGCAAASDCPECGRSVDWTTPLAPVPDYRIEERLECAGFRDRGDGWHEPERCSCEEALALREEQYRDGKSALALATALAELAGVIEALEVATERELKAWTRPTASRAQRAVGEATLAWKAARRARA
jgi:hypothetical protein